MTSIDINTVINISTTAQICGTGIVFMLFFRRQAAWLAWRLIKFLLRALGKGLEACLQWNSRREQNRIADLLIHMPSAVALLIWCITHQQSLDDVRRCGTYFNYTRPGLPHPPSRWVMAGLAALTLLLLLLTATAPPLIATNQALLRMKSTGTWFAMSETSVGALTSHARLALSECEENVAPSESRGGLSAPEIKTICATVSGMGKNKLSGYIDSVVTQQRWLFSIAGILIALMLYQFSTRLRQAIHARQMLRQLEDKGKAKY